MFSDPNTTRRKQVAIGRREAEAADARALQFIAARKLREYNEANIGPGKKFDAPATTID